MSSGYGQRGGPGGGAGQEAPACVQNAMMTKDKKPFTYTPGGIDLSQIRSERMAKRLARNAQSEGTTGSAQQNRPAQPQSPGGGSGTAANSMGAAAMGMPFQVLPPPPPPAPPAQTGKNGQQFAAAAPPPPPPQQQLAPPSGRLSAPGSPAAARKSPTPQRFEPPPLGFRPEIKIPPNPMAALKKVPPPVEKNTFWKDEYCKERSKSPLPETAQNGDAVDGYKTAPTSNSYQQQPAQLPSPKTPPMQPQLPTPPASPPQQQQQQQQQSRQEFRSVPMPQSPAVNVYTRQTDSPRSPFEQQQQQLQHLQQQQQQQQRSTESPFRYAQQQRPPTATSPLAQPQQQQQQQSTQSVPWRTQRAQPASPQQPTQQQQQQQQHPQPIFNNIQQQQRSRDVFSPARNETAATSNNAPQQQNYGTQQTQYPGAGKPTNVGSLYIAPLAQPTEPQAQRLLLQQQQTSARDSPMRQLSYQQQQQQQPQQPPQQPQSAQGQPLRWLSSQPASKEQAPWARPEENGNILPSQLRQTTPAPQPQVAAAPPPPQSPPQPQPTSFYQPQLIQGNGYGSTPAVAHNYGSNSQPGGLRLQINLNTNGNNNMQQNTNQSGPRERIIPITLEQTPTYAAAQPNFGAPAGHIIRSANQFVDQGYNNYPPTASGPTNNINNSNGTRIIPITIDVGRGGPISQTPVLLQNDPRSPPIQSKSFRILQKITDTVDDGSGDKTPQSPAPQQTPLEPPQLQRPQFARQMSAQQARNSPTIEQMRRLQIAQDQQQQMGTPLAWSPQGNGVSAQNRFAPQRYDTPSSPQQQQQQYVPPSEQQAPEPKKYTGSAIPSRSFKILQAMTTPENAGPGQSDL